MKAANWASVLEMRPEDEMTATKRSRGGGHQDEDHRGRLAKAHCSGHETGELIVASSTVESRQVFH